MANGRYKATLCTGSGEVSVIAICRTRLDAEARLGHALALSFLEQRMKAVRSDGCIPDTGSQRSIWVLSELDAETLQSINSRGKYWLGAGGGAAREGE